jgi:gamma-glutamylcyclotransferase (GGCT)/AIG2-like uncharacterized protein YtfP
MNTLRYLAYGSNLHPQRMKHRVPSARVAGTVHLPGWALRIHKRGADGSAKCNVVHTGDAGDRVHGVVYEMVAHHRAQLDACEGAGYRRQRLNLAAFGEVFLYVARSPYIDDGLVPFGWYIGYVLEGARYHGFPRDYIELIDRLETRADPDPERHRRHSRLIIDADG